MKNLITSLIFIFTLSYSARSQEHKPQLLFEPAAWEFERFELPPSFAPGIPYKGAEELRFAPGMFKKDTITYFTYVFVAELAGVMTISQNDIRDYLLKYYIGLCSATARDRKLTIDTTKITATVERKKGTTVQESIYDASLDIFGVFADGAPVKLNMEIKILKPGATKKTYLFFIASASEKTDPIWKTLYEIREKFAIPKMEHGLH
ncbi:MAG: hypothetical protein ACHQFX_15400 [Chitinophagales bacterium]